MCFALLIDADNVSARYIKPILTELSKYGNITYKRIYGDWTNTQHSSWKDELLKNSITPIQQFSYTQGKNSTDSAMIIDAMDILYAKDVDGFCIVSSDSDFTRLVSRLRESGKMVIGMGENKTPEPFRKACDKFTILENLLSEKGLEDGQAGVGAVIASVTVDMAAPIVKEKNHLSLIIMCVAFIAACVFSVNVVYIVIACGVIGVIRTLLLKRRSVK